MAQGLWDGNSRRLKSSLTCVLVKAGDAANWTVGRTSSGFPQTGLINLRLGTYARLDGRSCATERFTLRKLQIL
jgi:hypothetical protein